MRPSYARHVRRGILHRQALESAEAMGLRPAGGGAA